MSARPRPRRSRPRRRSAAPAGSGPRPAPTAAPTPARSTCARPSPSPIRRRSPRRDCGSTSTTATRPTSMAPTSQLVDVKSLLVPGTNVIAMAATNTSNGASGAIAKLDMGATSVVSDASWKASRTTPPDGWTTAAFDASSWSNAFANAGYGAGPWGTVADPGNGAGAKTPAGELRGGFRYLTVENPGPGTLSFDAACVQ